MNEALTKRRGQRRITWSNQNGKPLLVAVGAALALGLSRSTIAEPVHIDPGMLPSVGRVEARFQSYNVEMAEIIGGRFWRPYARMNDAPEAPSSAGQAVTLDAHLFATRPPADLSNRRLRVLAAALGPAYIRISGSWANTLYFQNDDNPPLSTPPIGYQGVLTRAQWRGAVAFAHAVGARLVTSFAIHPAVRDASGTWTPVQARAFMEYTGSIGGEIYAAELFNEPNLASHAGGPPNYDGTAFARDIAAFRAFAAQVAPVMRIVGPGDVSTANFTVPGSPSTEDLLSAKPRPRFDIYDYHFYPAVSQRCAPPGSPVGTSVADALTEAWFARTDAALQARKTLYDRYAPNTPIWLTETAGAACGGTPWDATFLDTFRYLDQMGRLAKQGVSAIFHNTLAASEYGLIDDTTLEPRPSYWAALLWRRLMGEVVLDAGKLRPGFHIYAQCLRDRPGGVSVLAINSSDQPETFEASQPAEMYIFTADAEQSATVRLNDRLLAMRSRDRLPKIRPQRVREAKVTLVPRSIGFIALPHAHNPNCN
jgi:heparanase